MAENPNGSNSGCGERSATIGGSSSRGARSLPFDQTERTGVLPMKGRKKELHVETETMCLVGMFTNEFG